MKQETIDVFRKLKQKTTVCTPSTDIELDKLASMINECKKKSYHVGSGHYVNDFDYFFIEWDNQAAVAIKDTKPGEEPGYTFFDFAIENNIPTELQGIYSTSLRTNTARFGGRMGCVVTEAPGQKQEAAKDGLAFGMIYEALTAKLNSGTN